MAIVLDGLFKQYVAPDGSSMPVIDIERLSLDDGEQVSLIGASGSGKTTLLHLIAGILTPDRGRILFKSNADGATGEIDLALLSEGQRDIFRVKG